ncbi:MAG: hypothetical protein BWY75_01046 [bacterium ADurb.Bin425]|nr:MAG: hypothetical protein BWY75_01046 [bacterium ADurb.Bin425]
MHARHIGQVGGDVSVCHRYFAVLHVFWVHKQNVVNHVKVLEQNGTDKSVKVASSNQPTLCGNCFLGRRRILCACHVYLRVSNLDFNGRMKLG